MRYSKPQYYDKFKCIAGTCPDTCCAGWQIVIDDEALETYEKVPGPFGERLRDSIHWEEGIFRQNGRRCSFLNEENLCDLYQVLGEKALCKTCTMYPRHVEEFADVREYSLSLSCPVAAKMILEYKNPLQFIVTEDDLPDELEDEFEDFDYLFYSQLEEAREVILEILQNRQWKMHDRMQLVLKMADEMQTCVDEERFFDIEEVLERYKRFPVIEEKPKEKRYEQRCEEFSVLLRLERLREEWSEVLQDAWEGLLEQGEVYYRKTVAEFAKFYGEESAREKQWSNMLEQLMVFFVYTYFCGAVYDDEIYGKIAISVFCAQWIEELIMSRWIQTDGTLSYEDCIEVSYRLAREIEHSDENLEMVENYLTNKRNSGIID